MENKFLESLHKFFHQWCLTSVPNPANTVINIVSEVNSPFTVHLYNLVGNNVTEAKINGNSIDVSEVPVGMYFVRLKFEGSNVVKKIAIQR